MLHILQINNYYSDRLGRKIVIDRFFFFVFVNHISYFLPFLSLSLSLLLLFYVFFLKELFLTKINFPKLALNILNVQINQ